MLKIHSSFYFTQLLPTKMLAAVVNETLTYRNYTNWYLSCSKMSQTILALPATPWQPQMQHIWAEDPHRWPTSGVDVSVPSTEVYFFSIHGHLQHCIWEVSCSQSSPNPTAATPSNPFWLSEEAAAPACLEKVDQNFTVRSGMPTPFSERLN